MSRRSSTLILASLSMSMLIASLGTSIANAGLPLLSQVFGAPFQSVQWVALSYLLTVTSLVVSVGRLGDLVGRRRLLLAGIATFAIASVFCGLAPNLPILIAARAIQGSGAAVMLSLTLSIVGETVPKERIGTAIGLLGTMSAIGTALGPSLGGAMASYIGWRSIFLVNLPVSILALYLTHRHLPKDAPVKNENGSFDILGTLTLGLTLAAFAISMTVGKGNFGLLNLAFLAGSAVAGRIFVMLQKRGRSPLIQIDMFRDPAMSSGLAMNFLVSTVLMTTLVVGPFFLSRGLALSATQVGFLLSIGPLVVAISGIPSGWLADRYGASKMSFLGLAGIATGSLLLSTAPFTQSVWGYAFSIIVVTAGYAAFQTSNNTTVMAGADRSRSGVASGTLTLSRNLGLITGASVMGAVFSAATGSIDDPMAVAQGFRTTFAVASGLTLAALAIGLRGKPRLSARPPCLKQRECLSTSE